MSSNAWTGAPSSYADTFLHVIGTRLWCNLMDRGSSVNPANPATASKITRLSVIVPNFNYAQYIRQAVLSALHIDWPDVEVIVVDDGSTDDSVAVLEELRDQVTLIMQENRGPREACNAGFAASTGDAIIFLDSDDLLLPELAHEVANVWTSSVSKVQVQMVRIDEHGRRFGRIFPQLRQAPTPDEIRYWITETSAYPTPPGSGNVYSRSFLEKIFPLDDRCGDATDSACLAAAPFLGDVLTIIRPLVCYRVHGANRSALMVNTCRFSQQIERAVQRQKFAAEISRDPRYVPLMGSLRRGRHLLQMRVTDYRLCQGTSCLPGDGFRMLCIDIFRSASAPGPEGLLYRAIVPLWCMAVLIAPRPIARLLARWRFV